MRCTDCNRYVTFDSDVEPEVDVEITYGDDGNVYVQGNVRIANNCADCGSEMTEASFDVDETVHLIHEEGCERKEEDEPSFDDPEAERFDEYDPPGKPTRYSKHMYGASMTVEASCRSCGAKGSVEWRDSVQSSGMSPLM